MTAMITHEPLIRYAYSCDFQWSIEPREEYTGDFTTWKEFMPENLGTLPSFSAMGVYFALQLHATLDVPIGMIGTYWGGTCIEAWTPREGFEGIDSLKAVASYPVTLDWDNSLAMGAINGPQQQPGVLFNEMVNPWTPFAVRGMIWYQGCNNSKDGIIYCDKMHALYNGWSRKFQNPDLKLYFVQLAPWAESFFDIQLAQEKFADEQPNAGLVPTCDIGNTWDIHPYEKGTVGRRLATIALAHTYGFGDIVGDYPRVVEAHVTGDTVFLTCSNADTWYVYNKFWEVDVPFEVRDENGNWHKARLVNSNEGREVGSPGFTTGVVKGADLQIASHEVKAPTGVRYIHENPWTGNLYAGSGWPLAPFEIEIPDGGIDQSNPPRPILSIGQKAVPVQAIFAPMFGTPFTDHAVLQRDCELPVWGSATAGAKVSVAFDDIVKETVADEHGKWRVDFPPQKKPGFGHTLTLATEGHEPVVLSDIAIGDVWICSGQSNMAMNYFGGLTRGHEDMENADFDDIRLFNMMEAFSIRPLARYPRLAEWHKCDFEAAKGFTACGFFFAQSLREALPGVPLGIVNSSWAGSAISVWMSEEAYTGADDYCAAAMESVKKQRAAFEAAGGKAGYEARVKKWEEDCNNAGAIPAERENFDDSEWKVVNIPSFLESHYDMEFDGCVWYRRTVELTAEQAAAHATIKLGAVDDFDWTYVNGRLLGHQIMYNAQRDYAIPAGVLREGRNTIAVKVQDNGGYGGFTSPAENLLIDFDGADDISLAGKWRTVGFKFDARPVDTSVIQYWTPAACFNAMIHPLFPMAAKGVLWYQGCSDVGEAQRYRDQAEALVREWREGFTSPDGLPFFIVQLAAFQQTHQDPVDSAWADMRWMQMQLGESLGKSGTAVIIDVGDHDDIHPKDKKTPGERLARLARVRAYGEKGIVDAGPIPVSAKIANGKVAVGFKGKPALALSEGDALTGFQLAGEDGRFAWATGSIDGARVLLDIPEGMIPATVRYAWDDYPACNLVGEDKLPCGPFELAIKQ